MRAARLWLPFAILSHLLTATAFGGIKPANQHDESLSREAKHSVEMALDYLKGQQKPEGYWGTPDNPAITGLALYALLTSEKYKPKGPRPEFIEKGIGFILKNVKADGGIYKAELSNYNTSVCMMALLATKDSKYNPVLANARNFLPTQQLTGHDSVKVASQLLGGVGYGTKNYSDMADTYFALEAMKMSQFLKQEQAKSPLSKSLDWNAALQFVQRCQNLKSTNDQDWASDDSANKGGFVYFPGNSKAGEQKLSDGKTVLRSYGSMTYAGLLSLIYADVDMKDQRIQAAHDWLVRNYTLDENPGMGQQGLYFYYHTMAKALSIYGQDQLYTSDGRQIDWRKEFATKLIEKQKGDGLWVNDNGRWMENDPVLATSYSLIAMNLVLPRL